MTSILSVILTATLNCYQLHWNDAVCSCDCAGTPAAVTVTMTTTAHDVVTMQRLHVQHEATAVVELLEKSSEQKYIETKLMYDGIAATLTFEICLK